MHTYIRRLVAEVNIAVLRIHTYIHTCIHTHMHTYIRRLVAEVNVAVLRIHTYIHTHIHTYAGWLLRLMWLSVWHPAHTHEQAPH